MNYGERILVVQKHRGETRTYEGVVMFAGETLVELHVDKMSHRDASKLSGWSRRMVFHRDVSVFAGLEQTVYTLEHVGSNEYGKLYAVTDEDGDVVVQGLDYADGSGVLVGAPDGEAWDGVDEPRDLFDYVTATCH